MSKRVYIRLDGGKTYTLLIDGDEYLTGTLAECQRWANYFTGHTKRPE